MEDKIILKACAGLPNGAAELDYSPLSAASEQLRDKRITGVECTGHNTIRIVLDDRSSVSFTPSGAEGENLDLSIHSARDEHARNPISSVILGGAIVVSGVFLFLAKYRLNHGLWPFDFGLDTSFWSELNAIYGISGFAILLGCAIAAGGIADCRARDKSLQE